MVIYINRDRENSTQVIRNNNKSISSRSRFEEGINGSKFFTITVIIWTTHSARVCLSFFLQAQERARFHASLYLFYILFLLLLMSKNRRVYERDMRRNSQRKKNCIINWWSKQHKNKFTRTHIRGIIALWINFLIFFCVFCFWWTSYITFCAVLLLRCVELCYASAMMSFPNDFSYQEKNRCVLVLVFKCCCLSFFFIRISV